MVALKKLEKVRDLFLLFLHLFVALSIVGVLDRRLFNHEHNGDTKWQR